MSNNYPELLTIRDFIRWGASRFVEANLIFGHGTNNALDEAAHLVLHALHLSHKLPPTYLDAKVTLSEKQQISALLQRRIKERIPAAYLVHEAWFAGLAFYVDDRVLVPRSPIAEWIEKGFEPWLTTDQPISRILDLCTGSGCIAIACAYAFPEAQVDAADLSPEALAVTHINLQRHLLEDRIKIVESDLFAALAKQRYDLIISNPPYVSQVEMDLLPQEFQHEPALGLVGGDLGLDVVLRILVQAHAHLNPGGLLVMETGNSATALEHHFPNVSFLWLDCERGGHGVLLFTAEQLHELHPLFVLDKQRQ